MEPTTLSRSDLYELVWSEPMRSLAKRFGVSDVALAKRCKRLRIPVPGRGYWAMKSAGRRVYQPALSVARTPAEGRPIIFAPHPPATPEPEVREGPVWNQEQFETRPENRITVSDRLSRHAAIRATAASLRAQRGPATAYIHASGEGALGVAVTRQLLTRALHLLDAFVRACEVRGWDVRGYKGYKGDKRESRVNVLGQSIAFRLREPQRRIDRLKEPGELSKPGEYVYDRYRFEGNGALEFAIGDQYAPGSCHFRDGKRQRLEDCLNQIMVALVEAAVALSERDVRWRREEEERQRQALIAHQERTQRETEEGRVKQLLADTEGWARAQQLRAFANAVEEALLDRAAGPLPIDTTAWLAWAHYVADEMDALSLEDPVAYLSREPSKPSPEWPRY